MQWFLTHKSESNDNFNQEYKISEYFLFSQLYIFLILYQSYEEK